MAHSHSHMSSHLSEDNSARRLSYAFGTTAGFMLVKAVGGSLSGSLALLADAGHMLTDTAALLFALFAVQSSRHPPTIRHIFGWLRLTTFAAFVNAVALATITILIVWEVVGRSRTSRPVEDGAIMVTAVTRLLANVLFFWLPHYGNEEKNLNVRAAALHVLGDPLDSAGVIIAALIITWTGRTSADSTLSILVSPLVLRSTWRLLKGSVNELLEGTSVSLGIAELKYCMRRETPEVRDVHHVHVWVIGEKPVMMLHVQVIPPHDHDTLLDRIQHCSVDYHQIEYVTTQMEYQSCYEPDCHLNGGVFGHPYHHH